MNESDLTYNIFIAALSKMGEYDPNSVDLEKIAISSKSVAKIILGDDKSQAELINWANKARKYKQGL